MAVTTYNGWVADGKPAHPAQPIQDMLNMFESHGFTVYWYPDESHQKAQPPEDHTPYSNTPWPGAQPYPACLALDLMPKDGDARSLTKIARQMIADKDSGVAPWFKYINWTDENNACWHTKWEPTKETTSSSDTGHVHVSIRTDFASSSAAQGYDPVTPHLQGDAMAADKFLAVDAGGQYYICDLDTSRKISAADAGTKVYLAFSNYSQTPGQGSGSLGRGTVPQPPHPEWLDFAGYKAVVRNGWSQAFGTLIPESVTVDLTPDDIDALAQKIHVDSGASIDQIKALLNGASIHTA